MNHLLRELAPVSEAGWSAIEDEATRSLSHFLAARKLVDFDGPHGWDAAAVNTGRARTIAAGATAEAGLREAKPLVEVRVPFAVSRAELAAIDRGAADADLDAVIAAARIAAETEDKACFAGWSEAGITGIVDAPPHPRLTLPEDHRSFPEQVAKAISVLLQAGIGGRTRRPSAATATPGCSRRPTSTAGRCSRTSSASQRAAWCGRLR